MTLAGVGVTVEVSNTELPKGNAPVTVVLPAAFLITVAVAVVPERLLVKVHAIGWSAAPVKDAVVPFKVVVTLVPPTEHCAVTKVYPVLGVSVTVTVGVVPASTVTAAGATPLAPLTAAVVTGEATVPLEMVFANVHPLASAGVGLISAPLEFWICLVIVSWLLQAPVASILRMVPKSEFELLK